MNNEDAIEQVVREEMRAFGSDIADLPSSVITIKKRSEAGNVYAVTVEMSEEARWPRFLVEYPTSDERLRDTIRAALRHADFLEQMRQIRRAERRHMLMPSGACWCGHGDRTARAESFDKIDGSHSMVNIGHQPSCPPGCNAFHGHEHCADCAAEGNKEACCV